MDTPKESDQDGQLDFCLENEYEIEIRCKFDSYSRNYDNQIISNKVNFQKNINIYESIIRERLYSSSIKTNSYIITFYYFKAKL